MPARASADGRSPPPSPTSTGTTADSTAVIGATTLIVPSPVLGRAAGSDRCHRRSLRPRPRRGRGPRGARPSTNGATTSSPASPIALERQATATAGRRRAASPPKKSPAPYVTADSRARSAAIGRASRAPVPRPATPGIGAHVPGNWRCAALRCSCDDAGAGGGRSSPAHRRGRARPRRSSTTTTARPPTTAVTSPPTWSWPASRSSKRSATQLDVAELRDRGPGGDDRRRRTDVDAWVTLDPWPEIAGDSTTQPSSLTDGRRRRRRRPSVIAARTDRLPASGACADWACLAVGRRRGPTLPLPDTALGLPGARPRGRRVARGRRTRTVADHARSSLPDVRTLARRHRRSARDPLDDMLVLRPAGPSATAVTAGRLRRPRRRLAASDGHRPSPGAVPATVVAVVTGRRPTRSGEPLHERPRRRRLGSGAHPMPAPPGYPPRACCSPSPRRSRERPLAPLLALLAARRPRRRLRRRLRGGRRHRRRRSTSATPATAPSSPAPSRPRRSTSSPTSPAPSTSSDAAQDGDRCWFIDPRRKSSGAGAQALARGWDEAVDGPVPGDLVAGRQRVGVGRQPAPGRRAARRRSCPRTSSGSCSRRS